MQAHTYRAVILDHILNLVFQAEEAVRSRPAGWWMNGHVQAVLHLLTLDNLGTIRLNWTEEKDSKDLLISNGTTAYAFIISSCIFKLPELLFTVLYDLVIISFYADFYLS